jgi:tetratricopeptide (TPR) repeat protein
MKLSHLIPFWFTLCICPSVCSAQSNSIKSTAANIAPTVSVRELSIPEAASKAFDKGTQLLAAKDWAGGASQFRKAIRSFPVFYEAFYRLGIAEEKLGYATEAESAFRKSIELSDGRYAPPHFGLALILADDKKQYAEAEAMVRSGLALDDADAAGYFALAWILYTTDRLADAENAAREALLLEPGLAVSRVLLAEVHLRQGKPLATATNLDTYLKLDPDAAEDAAHQAIRIQGQQNRSQADAASLGPEENP